MKRAQARPQVQGGSTATMNRLRQSIAENAVRRSQHTAETDGEPGVDDPYATALDRDPRDDDGSFEPVSAPAGDDRPEVEDRLADLRRMARRLAEQSRETGDLRRRGYLTGAASGADRGEFDPIPSRSTSTVRPDRSTADAAREPSSVYPAESEADVPMARPAETRQAASANRRRQPVQPADMDTDRSVQDEAVGKSATAARGGRSRLTIPLAVALVGALAAGAYVVVIPALKGRQPVVAEASRPTVRPLVAEEPAVLDRPARVSEPVAPPPQPIAEPVEPPTPSPTIVAEAPSPTAAEAVASAPQPQASEPAPAPAPAQPAEVDLKEIIVFIAKGASRMAVGDIAGARRHYQRAADLSDGQAAYLLAETFDPVVLSLNGANRVRPDVAAARRWYTLASERGVTSATAALARLPKR